MQITFNLPLARPLERDTPAVYPHYLYAGEKRTWLLLWVEGSLSHYNVTSDIYTDYSSG